MLNEKGNIVATLRELHSLSASMDFKALTSQIEDEIHKVEKNEFYLVVLGQFKRGKTSFINAILGEELLPVGVIPVTAIVTFIRYGEQIKIDVVNSNGLRQSIEKADLPQYVAEKGNPNNEKQVRAIEIAHPCQFLRNGVVLVDTPGIGSISLNNTQTTQEFLPHIDAAIVVLSSDPPITQTESEFVDEVRTHGERIFFVLNKIDMMSDADLSEALTYTQAVIRGKTNTYVDIYPISAVMALKAKNGEEPARFATDKIRRVELAIQSYLKQEKLEQLLHNSVKRIQRFANELRFTTELQLKAIETPLHDLEAKIERFNQYLETLQHDRKRTYIMTGELASLRSWIADELQLFQKAETLSLHHELSHWVSGYEDTPNRELLESTERAMMDRLITDFEMWRIPYHQEILSRFNKILARAVNEMNLLVDKIVQQSANLFNVRVEAFPELDPPLPKPNFAYKIKDDPTFIEIDALKFAFRVLPLAISRQIVMRKLKERIAEKVMVNCGRLLSNFVTDLDEQYRRFQGDLDNKTEEATTNIKRILSDATQREQEDTSAVAARVALLHEHLKHLDDLSTDITNVEPMISTSSSDARLSSL